MTSAAVSGQGPFVRSAGPRDLGAGAPGSGRAIVRGGLMLMGAKLVHACAGFGLFFFLAALLYRSSGAAGVAAFGVYGTVLAVINPLNMMFAQGSLAVVSQLVARRADGGAVVRAVLVVQGGLVLLFVVAFQLAAPLLAGGLLGDGAYTTPLRVAGLIPACYGLRCVYQGWCNGAGRFAAQSWIDVSASLLRVALVLGAAALGFGAVGALGGFLVSAVIVLALAVVVTSRERGRAGPRLAPHAPHVSPAPPAPPASPASHAPPASAAPPASHAPPASAAPPLGEVLSLALPVLALTLVTYGLLSVDTLWVKAAGPGSSAVSDRYVGYFTGALKIAQVPWALVMGLAWVLFPHFAARSEAADPAGRRAFVHAGLRVVLLLVVPAAAVLAGSAHDVYAAVFPGHLRSMATFGDPRDVVSGPLLVLAPAYVLFTLLAVSTMLITAAGHPLRSLGVLAATLVVAVALSGLLFARLGPLGAALGSALAWGAGLVAASIVLVRRHDGRLPLASAARIVGCGLIVFAAGRELHATGAWLVLEALALAGLDLVLLLLVREVSLDELAASARLVVRERRPRLGVVALQRARP